MGATSKPLPGIRCCFQTSCNFVRLKSQLSPTLVRPERCKCMARAEGRERPVLGEQSRKTLPCPDLRGRVAWRRPQGPRDKARGLKLATGDSALQTADHISGIVSATRPTEAGQQEDPVFENKCDSVQVLVLFTREPPAQSAPDKATAERRHSGKEASLHSRGACYSPRAQKGHLAFLFPGAPVYQPHLSEGLGTCPVTFSKHSCVCRSCFTLSALDHSSSFNQA